MLKTITTAIWLAVIFSGVLIDLGFPKSRWGMGEILIILLPYIIAIVCISIFQRKELLIDLEKTIAEYSIAKNNLYSAFPEMREKTKTGKHKNSHAGHNAIHATDLLIENTTGIGHAATIAVAGTYLIGSGIASLIKNSMKSKSQKQLEEAVSVCEIKIEDFKERITSTYIFDSALIIIAIIISINL